MAIYDVDAILEAEAQTVEESEIDNESVLDGMLEACESMMNAINESKARLRTAEVLSKEAKKHAKNADAYSDLERAAQKVGHAELYEKYHKQAQDSINKAYNSNLNANKIKGVKSSPDDLDIYDNQEAERRFKAMYDAHPAKGDRKPGYYKNLYEKKKAIKETCLTILSVIDDI